MLLSNPFSGIMLILLLPLASVTGVATVSHLHSELFTERHMVLMLSFFYSRICIVLFYLLVSWLHTWLCIHWPGMSMLHSNFLYISYVCVLFITSLFFIFFLLSSNLFCPAHRSAVLHVLVSFLQSQDFHCQGMALL